MMLRTPRNDISSENEYTLKSYSTDVRSNMLVIYIEDTKE